MPVLLNELLQPQVITATISKLAKAKAGRLSQLFGMHLGGPNKTESPTRYAEWRIDNHTREAANFRAPATAPATRMPNPYGAQRFAMTRVHEKIPLDAEMLGNLSPIIGPNAQIDEGGQNYIKRQEGHLAELFQNSVEVMVAGMIRGAMYLTQSGDNWVPYLSSQGGTELTIDWNIPSGNKTQLDILGAGSLITQSWDDASAQIVKQMLSIRGAYESLTGAPLTDALVNSTTLGKFIGNTELRTVGGSVQSTFDAFTYEDEMGMDGMKVAGKGVITFRALPWLRFHIIDQTLSIGGTDPIFSTGTGTRTAVVPNDKVIFMTEPSADWVTMYHGSEYVSENHGQPLAKKTGFSTWHTYTIEPSGVSIVGLLNLLPVIYRENNLLIGTVVF